MRNDDLNIDQINLTTTKERSIQVVRFIPQNNKFELNPEATEFFSSLQGDNAFVVVCGKYRTGKSFLLNKILEITGDGFQVSPNTESCTQGIWLYTKPLVNPINNLNIYFLDSEGSESVERSQAHDAKIFALAILMSSIFAFNSIGCIDEQSISQLQLTTTLAKNIQVQDSHNDQGNENLVGYYTPKFIWILRDYVLEMQDRSGRKITPKEYLENALHDESAYVKTNENNKRIRKSLLQFFKDRNCFTLIRPVADEEQFKTLNRLPFNQLRKEFQTEVLALKDNILKNCSPKQINGVNLNGRMYCQMLETYINVINRGGIPNIASAWEHIIENECQFAFDSAQKLYDQNLRLNFGADEAKTFEEIFFVLKKIRDDSYEKFHTIAGIREKNNHFENYRQKLQEYMNEKEQQAIRLNDDMNTTKNEEIIATTSKELKDNLNNGNYTADDIDFFLAHFNSFLNNYDQQSCGTQKANTLIHFLKTNHPTIIKQLIQSIKLKYDKTKNVEYEKGIYQEKEKNYIENIKILEQNISQHEGKIRKLDQEKVQLEATKKQLQEQLDKLTKENQVMRNNTKDVDDLKIQIQKKEEEITNLKQLLQSMQTKKKKGCCG